MNEIKRVIMGYAWEVAKREAKKEGCSARECFAWALAKAWKEFKHCDRCAFDIPSVMEAVEEYEKEENFKKCPYCLLVVFASLGMLERKFVLSWKKMHSYSYAVEYYDTTGDRYNRLDDARKRQSFVYAVSGEMPTLIYAFSGVKRGC